MKEESEFVSYTKKLCFEGHLSTPSHIFIREDNYLYAFQSNIHFSELNNSHIVQHLLQNRNDLCDKSTILQYAASVFLKNKNIHAVCLNTNSYVLACAVRGESISPLLDDAAQIIGSKLKCIPVYNSYKRVKRSAVIVKDNGIMCFASNLYDLQAVAMVCEKNCTAAVCGGVLGGMKRISFFDSLLMRFIYTVKYARKAGK